LSNFVLLVTRNGAKESYGSQPTQQYNGADYTLSFILGLKSEHPPSWAP
jgi:hypothetical protein